MLDDSCCMLDDSIRLRIRVRAVPPPPSAAVPPASEVRYGMPTMRGAAGEGPLAVPERREPLARESVPEPEGAWWW